jgi:hypothetical protein
MGQRQLTHRVSGMAALNASDELSNPAVWGSLPARQNRSITGPNEQLDSDGTDATYDLFGTTDGVRRTATPVTNGAKRRH